MKKHFFRSGQKIRALGREFARTAASFERKVFQACQRNGITRAERRFLRKLMGNGSPHSCLLASNAKARRRIVGRLRGSMTPFLMSGVDVLHVTILRREWVTSDEKTVIPLTQVRNEARRVLRSFGPNWIATAEIQAFANLGHPDGGKVLDTHVHGLVWGVGIAKGATTRARKWSRLWKAICPGARAVVADRATISEVDICRLLRYPWLLPDACKNLYVNDQGISRLTQSPKTDRYIRYLRLFQVLSLIPCEKLLFAEGEGVAFRTHALAESYRWLYRRTAWNKRSSEILAVADFWRKFMPKIGGGRFEMPIINA